VSGRGAQRCVTVARPLHRVLLLLSHYKAAATQLGCQPPVSAPCVLCPH